MSDEIDFIKPSADTVSKESHYSLRPRIKNRQHVSKARKLKEESETSKSSENEEDSCDNDDDSVHDQTENKLLRPYAQVNKELKSLKHDHDPQFTNQLNYTKSQLLNKKASEKAFLHESRYKVTSKPGTKCNSNKKTSSGLLCWILIPFMIILLGGSGYLYIVKPSKQLIIQDNLLHRWKESYSNLVIKYGDVLSETSRKIIKTSIEMVLRRKEPSEKFSNNEPAVLLLIGSKSNSQTVRCLFLNLAQAIAETFNEDIPPVFHAENMSDIDLHNRFHETLKTKALHSIVVDGIERFDGFRARSLHRYTDHDNAIYRDVIILFIAYSDKPIPSSNLSSLEMDRIANNILEVSWSKSLPEEQVAALLSRITPSVAVISDDLHNREWKC